MEFLLTAAGAALLTLTGAFISGGLRLPHAPSRREAGREMSAEDEFGRDLAALLGYQAEIDTQETEEEST
ncbi:MAG: hypothetical protein AB7C89_07215 [Intestinibacillus sp.]